MTIITAFQLMMLGVVLMTKRNRPGNLILMLYMFANAFLLIWFFISIINIFQVPLISPFYYLLGPLIYLYVISLTTKNFRLNTFHLTHGIVFVVMAIYVTIKLFLMVGKADETWNHFEFLISQLILHLQITFYVFISFRALYLYRKEIKNHYSAVEQINLSWLLLILVAFTAMWLADFTDFMLTIFKLGSATATRTLLVTSITINFIFANIVVYKGLRQPDAFSGLKTPEKYSGSKIKLSEIGKQANRLKTFMLEKKPYINPNLTIKDLSEELGLASKYLSQVINSQFDQNFYDFINKYRVKEAQEIITKSSDEKLTILEISYEVGFNSKSAFNNAFKKNTGKTPSEFKRSFS